MIRALACAAMWQLVVGRTSLAAPFRPSRARVQRALATRAPRGAPRRPSAFGWAAAPRPRARGGLAASRLTMSVAERPAAGDVTPGGGGGGGAAANACRPPSLVDDDGALAKVYDFANFEGALYEWWESQGFFAPECRDGERADGGEHKRGAYVLPMPPPNVTGYLHMGHAMFVALQDILARFHRMRRRPTLWLPGTDHAGIATQLLVERALVAEGTSREALGREAFTERVWQWKEEKGGYIMNQMRRLGASADWSREKFTLEPAMSEAVVEAFVRLHEAGLLYKGSRMVNWSPNLRTAVSDLEVEYADEVGKLYKFKYPLVPLEEGAPESEFVPVATTRPETILGDTAVAVHPDDERFRHLVGRELRVPGVTPERRIPLITDTYVQMEFGTGALKITPAHDPNDYEVRARAGEGARDTPSRDDVVARAVSSRARARARRSASGTTCP